MTQETFKTTILRPAKDHFLTQVQDVDIKERMIASVVALGKYDSADNYKEISAEEAEEIRKAQAQADREENGND